MINFSDALEAGLRDLRVKLNAEVQEKAMEKIAAVSSVIIRREMRMSGMKRSSETGTALGRSPSEQQKVAAEGSMFDIDKKVESYDERDIAFAGHALHKGAYRARFQGDGTEVHYLWDSTKTISLTPSPNHTGHKYLDKAKLTIKQEAKSIVKRGIASAVRKAKRSTYKQQRNP